MHPASTADAASEEKVLDKNKIDMAFSVEILVAQTRALQLEMYCHAQILRALTHAEPPKHFQEATTPAWGFDLPPFLADS